MVLVDSNVLLDLFSNDPQWFAWSQGALAQHGIRDQLSVNPIISP